MFIFIQNVWFQGRAFQGYRNIWHELKLYVRGGNALGLMKIFRNDGAILY